MSAYPIRRACDQDLDAVLGLRREAEQWLAAKEIVQWTPDYDEYAVGVLTRWIASGAAWVVEDGGDIVATASLNAEPDLDFWGWAESEFLADGLYLGKMIVRRDHAGLQLGDAIMDWAGSRALAAGRHQLRLDCRRDNDLLHRYYLDRGFRWLRTVVPVPPRVTESGWLAQRGARVTTRPRNTVYEIRDDACSVGAQRRETHPTSTSRGAGEGTVRPADISGTTLV